MTTRSEKRKEAYHYVLQVLSRVPVTDNGADRDIFIPLEELRVLKDGLADPSPALVSLIKGFFKGNENLADIDANLVKPFQSDLSE